MLYYDFSKSEKKIARALIEKGLQKEYAEGLSKAESILESWKNGSRDTRESYMALYKSVHNFDKHIARRYNNMGGSKYAFVIAQQVADEIISQDELLAFSPKSRNVIMLMSGIPFNEPESEDDPTEES